MLLDKCVNKKHPDFLKLVESTGIKSFILETKVGSWQTRLITDKFPSKDEIINYNVSDSLTIPNYKVKEHLGKQFKSNLSLDDFSKLGKQISITNLKNKKLGNNITYSYNKLEQLGKSDNYKWELIQHSKSLNVENKIKRETGKVPDASDNQTVLRNLKSQYELPFDSIFENTFDKNLAQKIQDKLKKLYPEIKLNITNNPIWEQGDNVFNQEEFNNQVNYRLKATEILLSDKAKQVFEKGQKNGWDLNKILTELQIPKEQKQLILDKNLGNREEIITSLLADNSFAVEVNTAKKKEAQFDTVDDLFEDSNYKELDENTQYYSNLTVPGGTNYTENEIATPNITPSIKGHAQFSTDKGIGWFRSDEQSSSSFLTKEEEIELSQLEHKLDYEGLNNKDSDRLNELSNKGNFSDIEGSKTRRILEVQSDLFQKGRDRKDLISTNITEVNNLVQIRLERQINAINTNKPVEYKKGRNIYDDVYIDGVLIEDSKYTKGKFNKEKTLKYLEEEKLRNISDKQFSSENQFLQLLNKKNNWVTFFIKSIIQDSAKKGYEKVLFPKGDTAAKIEGHQTLEEFKREKLSRISNLESQKEKISDTNEQWVIKNIDPYSPSEEKLIFSSSQEALDYINKDEYPDIWSEPTRQITNDERTSGKDKLEAINNEIKTLKQELADVESGKTQLSAIAKFYENTIFNILKKQGYNPVEITDEYGNTWNEISINQARDLANILLQRNEVNQIIGQANIKAMSVLIDAVNQKQDTLPHEYAHHYIAWFRNTPIVQEGIKKWGSEEALVQSIGEQVVKQKGEAYNWWNNFVKWIMNQFNSLSKLQKEELTQILTDAFLTRQNLNQIKEIDEIYKEMEKVNSISHNNVVQLQESFKDFKYSLLGFLDNTVKDIEVDVTDGEESFNTAKKSVLNQVEKINDLFNNEIFEVRNNELDSRFYTIKLNSAALMAAYEARTKDLNDNKEFFKSKKLDLADNTKKETIERANEKIEILRKSFPNVNIEFKESKDMPKDTFGYLRYDNNIPTIVLNQDNLKSDTVIHEFGHLYIDLLGGMNDPLVKRGRELLRGSLLESSVMETYPELSEEMLDKEILATAIGIEGAELADSNPFKTFLKVFYNRIKKLLGLDYNVAFMLAHKMLNNEVAKKNYKSSIPSYIQYSKSQDSESEKTLEEKRLNRIIDKLFEKITILQRKYRDGKSESFKTKINNLLEQIEQSKDVSSIIKYIDEVDRLSSSVLKELNKISFSDINATDLQNLKTFSGIFDLIDDVEELLEYSLQQNNEDLNKHYNEGHLDKDDFGNYSIKEDLDKEIKDLLSSKFSIVLSLSNKLNSIESINKRINKIDKKYKLLRTEHLVKTYSPYSTRVKSRYIKNYEKEFYNQYKNRKEASNKLGKELNNVKQEFINNKLSENEEKIKSETEEYIRGILETAPKDVDILSSWVVDPKNLNDDIIQITIKMLEVADFKAMNTFIDEMKDANSILEDFRKYKGNTSNMLELYDDLLEKDEKGNVTGYLIGKYLSYKGSTFNPVINKQYNKINDLRKRDSNHPLVRMYDYLQNLSKKRDSSLPEHYRLGKEFVYSDGMNVTNDYTYKLPSIEKNFIERLSEQGLKTGFIEGLKDSLSKDTSDTEFGEAITDDKNNLKTEQFRFKKVLVDEAGKERQKIPVHFRGNIRNKGQQSYDLLRITLADYNMALNYKEKSEIRPLIEMAVESLRDREVSQRKGFKYKVNALMDKSTPLFINGIESNSFKALNSIVQQRLYGISTVDMGDFELLGKTFNVNKLLNTVMKWTGDTMLIGNIHSAAVNLTQGKVFNFIEGASNGFFTTSNLKAAEIKYTADLKGIMDDATGTRVPKSMTNLLLEKFNALSEFSGVSTNFSHSNKIKRLTNNGTLHLLNNAGEHYIQATVAIAIMDTFKVEYNGKKIPLHEAYDIVNGKLKLKDGITLEPNLEARVSSRIREIVKQIHGNYDSDNLSMLQRYAHGKMIFMLRKWLIVGTQRRWRGIGRLFTRKEDIIEADKFYSEFLEQEVEGYYSTAAIFIKEIHKELLQLKFSLIAENWNNLSDYERSNIKKTIMEVSFMVLTILAANILAGLAKDADDEDKATYYSAAYLFRRLYGESRFYSSPGESLKILQTPAASISMIEKLGEVLIQGYKDPTERYKTGKRKGDLKLVRKIKRVLPITSQTDKKIQDIYEWLENN